MRCDGHGEYQALRVYCTTLAIAWRHTKIATRQANCRQGTLMAAKSQAGQPYVDEVCRFSLPPGAGDPGPMAPKAV